MTIEIFGRSFLTTNIEVRSAGPFSASQVRELMKENRALGFSAMQDLRQLGCPDHVFESVLQHRAERLKQFVAANARTDADRRAEAKAREKAMADDPSDDGDEEYSGKTTNGINARPCARCGFTRVKKVAPCQDYCSSCNSSDPYKRRK
jgi:hypothetical protein